MYRYVELNDPIEGLYGLIKKIPSPNRMHLSHCMYRVKSYSSVLTRFFTNMALAMNTESCWFIIHYLFTCYKILQKEKSVKYVSAMDFQRFHPLFTFTKYCKE